MGERADDSEARLHRIAAWAVRSPGFQRAAETLLVQIHEAQVKQYGSVPLPAAKLAAEVAIDAAFLKLVERYREAGEGGAVD